MPWMLFAAGVSAAVVSFIDQREKEEEKMRNQMFSYKFGPAPALPVSARSSSTSFYPNNHRSFVDMKKKPHGPMKGKVSFFVCLFVFGEGERGRERERERERENVFVFSFSFFYHLFYVFFLSLLFSLFFFWDHYQSNQKRPFMHQPFSHPRTD